MTREDRLSDFITDRAPDGDFDVEVLCADHVGTYVAPFPCRYRDSAWRNGNSGEALETSVVGWRLWKEPADRRRAPPGEGDGAIAVDKLNASND